MGAAGKGGGGIRTFNMLVLTDLVLFIPRKKRFAQQPEDIGRFFRPKFSPSEHPLFVPPFFASEENQVSVRRKVV